MELRSAGGSAARPRARCDRLAEFTVGSEPGGERGAAERVVAACGRLHLGDRQLDRIRTAVAEAVMNAMEHGNGNAADLPVEISVAADACRLKVAVVDHGKGREPLPAELPDLEAKLDGRQTTRGWGLYLMEMMTDGLKTFTGDCRNTVVLTFHLGEAARSRGASHGD